MGSSESVNKGVVSETDAKQAVVKNKEILLFIFKIKFALTDTEERRLCNEGSDGA